MIIILSIFLAILPLVFWFWIFYRSDLSYLVRAFLTFTVSLVFAGAYQFFFRLATESSADFDSLFGIAIPAFIIFLLMGGTQEYAKNIVIRLTGRKFFHSIDDVIELSIIAALGFSFVENLVYFLDFFGTPESGNYLIAFKRIVGRMFYVVPIQILGSGIFGYFYGVALFAKPVLQEKLQEGKKFFFTKKIHQILHLKSETIFYEEKVMEGFVITMLLHGIYSWLVHINLTSNQILKVFFDYELPFDEDILPLVGAIYLTVGSLWLFSLIENKKRYTEEDLLHSGEVVDEKLNKK